MMSKISINKEIILTFFILYLFINFLVILSLELWEIKKLKKRNLILN